MNRILVFGIALLAFSYPIVTSWLLILGVDTTLGNVAVKALITGLFLLVLIFGRARNFDGIIAASPLLIFFVFYGCRLLFDVILGDVVHVGQSKFYTLAYFFGLTLLPAIVTSLHLTKADAPLLHRWLFWAVIAANVSILVYMASEGVLETTEVFSGRFEVKGELEGTTVLNPIMVGLMGAILVAYTVGRLGAFALPSPWQQAYHGALLAAGGSNILAGASRGPALALGVTILVTLYLLVRSNSGARGLKLRGKLWIYGGALAAVLLYLIITQSETVFLFQRFAMMFDQSMGRVVELRHVIFSQAWQDFLSAPILGFSYMTSGGYMPHNMFLEALMATGLVGSVFLLLAMIAVLRGGWRLLLGRAGSAGISVALAGLCLFIVGLSSGSVGQFPEYWIFLTIVMVLGATTRLPQARRGGEFTSGSRGRGTSL